MREGFIEIVDGIWQCQKTSKPYSSRRNLGNGNFDNNGELKELTGKNSNGYYEIWINRKSEKFHRKVYEHFHGEIPNGYEIDHINRDKTNNFISNLRLATRQQQNYNKNKRKNCSSIFKGVCWHKRKEKWVAQIQLNGKQKHIGYFETELEAGLAYDAYVEENNIPNCTTNKSLGLL